jgi:hypothetical protein
MGAANFNPNAQPINPANNQQPQGNPAPRALSSQEQRTIEMAEKCLRLPAAQNAGAKPNYKDCKIEKSDIPDTYRVAGDIVHKSKIETWAKIGEFFEAQKAPKPQAPAIQAPPPQPAAPVAPPPQQQPMHQQPQAAAAPNPPVVYTYADQPLRRLSRELQLPPQQPVQLPVVDRPDVKQAAANPSAVKVPASFDKPLSDLNIRSTGRAMYDNFRLPPEQFPGMRQEHATYIYQTLNKAINDTINYCKNQGIPFDISILKKNFAEGNVWIHPEHQKLLNEKLDAVIPNNLRSLAVARPVASASGSAAAQADAKQSAAAVQPAPAGNPKVLIKAASELQNLSLTSSRRQIYDNFEVPNQVDQDQANLIYQKLSARILEANFPSGYDPSYVQKKFAEDLDQMPFLNSGLKAELNRRLDTAIPFTLKLQAAEIALKQHEAEITSKLLEAAEKQKKTEADLAAQPLTKPASRLKDWNEIYEKFVLPEKYRVGTQVAQDIYNLLQKAIEISASIYDIPGKFSNELQEYMKAHPEKFSNIDGNQLQVDLYNHLKVIVGDDNRSYSDRGIIYDDRYDT